MPVTLIHYKNDEVEGVITINHVVKEKTKQHKAYNYQDTINKVLKKLQNKKQDLIIKMEVVDDYILTIEDKPTDELVKS